MNTTIETDEETMKMKINGTLESIKQFFAERIFPVTEAENYTEGSLYEMEVSVLDQLNNLKDGAGKVLAFICKKLDDEFVLEPFVIEVTVG